MLVFNCFIGVLDFLLKSYINDEGRAKLERFLVILLKFKRIWISPNNCLSLNLGIRPLHPHSKE